MDPADLWDFFLWGYATTVLIEAPILWVGLSPRHPWTTRLVAGFWLTACTYPIVVLVLPLLLIPPEAQGDRSAYLVYLLVAETFAPVAECLLFWAAFYRPPPDEAGSDSDADENATKPVPADPPTSGEFARDMATIVVANLASFGLGMLIEHWRSL